MLVVDHHDSYTWNLVHLIAGVTGALPDVVEHDEPGVLEPGPRRTRTWCSRPGPATRRSRSDFALGREVFAARPARSSACAWGCRPWRRRTAGRSTSVEPAHGEVAHVEHDGTGVLAGSAAVVRGGALPLAGGHRGARRAAGDRDRGRRRDGPAHRDLPLHGVQFHPESVLSEHGAAARREFPGPPMTALEEFRAIAADHERCFWLDGGGSQGWSGSRSIMGWLEPDDLSLVYDAVRREVVEQPSGRVVGDDVFTAARRSASTGTPARTGSATSATPPAPTCRPAPSRACPTRLDARAQRQRHRGHGAVTDPPATCRWRSPAPCPRATPRPSPRCSEQLHAGNSYEVNLTYRLEQDSGPRPGRDLREAAQLTTRRRTPGCCGTATCGCSRPRPSGSPPSTAAVAWRPGRSRAPRRAARRPEEDEELRDRLASDPKFRAENLMITDLLRNDLAMVCEPGSVEVPHLMEVESYASVHQLVSTVTGLLRPEVGTVEALRAMFPAGSMTGAPKLRTMEIIDRVEDDPRGIYAGAFGWISGDGRADLGVVIRSLYRAGEGPWRLGTGGGITVRSDVEDEYAETLWKAARVRAAL